MKKTRYLMIVIIALLLVCSLVLASYITKKTDFIYETGIKVVKDNQVIENLIFIDIPVGILIWSSNNYIANCTFINCSDEGIVIFGNNNTVDNCVFYHCCDGIELQKSSDNSFIRCRFLNGTHAGIDGIYYGNDNNLIVDCLFYDNAAFGCYFTGSNGNEIINCTFLENQVDICRG